MKLNKLKGAPGISRFGITKIKIGRPNDNTQLDPKTKLVGRNMTTKYLNLWTKILIEQYAIENVNIAEAYRIFLLRAVSYNRNKDGELIPYAIAPEKLPDRKLFLKYGAKIIADLDLKRNKLGSIEYGQKHAAQRGHAEDLCSNVINIFDMDGMEFNCQILFKMKNGKNKHVGKPMVLLAVDRSSRAGVGWFVSLGNENGMAYKHCLFNAFTKKEDRLAHYNVSDLKGFVVGTCEQVFLDRGAGISSDSSKSFVEGLKVEQMIAKTKRGDGKGCVESVNGNFEHSLSTLPGAFRRSKHERDKDKHAKAEANAAIDWETFMALLLHAMSDYNLFTDVKHLLTKEMIENGVEPNPKAIFQWNKSMKRGDAAHEWQEAAIYKRLLTKIEKKAPDGIVTVNRAKYRSEELSQYYEKWNASTHKILASPTITIYEFQESDEFLLWERDDGSLSVLEIMDRSKLQYQSAERSMHSYINKLTNASARAQEINKAKNGTLSRAKEQSMQEVDKLPKIPIDKGNKLKNRKLANGELNQENLTGILETLGVAKKTAPPNNLNRIAPQLPGYQTLLDPDQILDVDW
jgi:hypothetical protein